MTARSRTTTSEAVAAHLVGLLFDGILSGGDRIDLDDVAGRLGVSRAAVRQGLMLLERDGLVRLSHHRGAFVAPFDAGTIREAFDLYGLLSAEAARRAAASCPPGMLETLTKVDEALGTCTDVDAFEQLAREFRRVVNLAAALRKCSTCGLCCAPSPAWSRRRPVSPSWTRWPRSGRRCMPGSRRCARAIRTPPSRQLWTTPR